MARALLVVAAMALFIGLAAAQLKICDDKKAPSAPWNTLLTKNVYEGGSSKLTMTWRSPVKSASDGCLDGYKIYIYDGNTGKKLGSDSMNANAITSPVTYTAAANPGQKVTLKIAAVDKMRNRESPLAEVGTVNAAAAPGGTQKPVPLRRML